MPAYYATTFIRQHGQVFICTEDYHAEDPNYFFYHEMLEFLNRTFVTKGAWKCENGGRLDFGNYTSKQVSEMMIKGLGIVEELGIEGEMPVYMRLQTLMSKGGLTQNAAEKFIEDTQMQAIVSHRDPIYKEKTKAFGKQCAKQVTIYTNREGMTVPIRMMQLNREDSQTKPCFTIQD